MTVKRKLLHTMARHKLGDIRQGLTGRREACGFKFYLTVNFFDDGAPGEIFVTIAKEGSTVSGFVDALAVTMSIALQYGVPWSVLYDKYLNQIFEPRDHVNSSLVHAIASGIDEMIKVWEAIHKPSTETENDKV